MKINTKWLGPLGAVEVVRARESLRGFSLSNWGRIMPLCVVLSEHAIKMEQRRSLLCDWTGHQSLSPE